MQSKRVAIVTQDPVNRGGVLRLTRYMYDRVLEVGAVPVLLHYASFKAWPDLSVSFANLARGKVVLSQKSHEYSFEGMDAIALGAWLPEWEPMRIASNTLWQETLKQFDAAILVTGSAHTGYPLAKSGKHFFAWLSSTVEDDRKARLASSSGLLPLVERMGLKRVQEAEREVLLAASKLYAVSHDAIRAIRSLDKSVSVALAPFPIDTEKYHPRPAPMKREPGILFVGRAGDPRKRVDLFLAALQEVSKREPELLFTGTVVSAMPIPAALRSQYSNLFDRITVLEMVSESALIDLYRSSSLFLFTSEQEGLGIAAMEAMACGTPVISTRSGGPETYIRDGKNGFLTSSNTFEISNRIYEILTGAALQEGLGKAAAETIEKEFSEHVWNERFDTMIRALGI
jgi:glycosyltransferase involved in cell wall biosynthesis